MAHDGGTGWVYKVPHCVARGVGRVVSVLHCVAGVVGRVDWGSAVHVPLQAAPNDHMHICLTGLRFGCFGAAGDQDTLLDISLHVSLHISASYKGLCSLL